VKPKSKSAKIKLEEFNEYITRFETNNKKTMGDGKTFRQEFADDQENHDG
jgi:hypothetical protein